MRMLPACEVLPVPIRLAPLSLGPSHSCAPVRAYVISVLSMQHLLCWNTCSARTSQRHQRRVKYQSRLWLLRRPTFEESQLRIRCATPARGTPITVVIG